jgi:LPXTG-motif cell wall-anchored protein
MKSTGKNLGNAAMAIFFVSLLSMPFVFAADIFLSESPNLIIRELKYDPYPLESGKYVNLWIKIDNYGSGNAEKVSCTIIPKYPFSLDSGENATQDIGMLPGMESAIIDYRIYVDAAAVEGNNGLDLECSPSSDGVITKRTISLYVTSSVPEFAVGTVSSQPTKLLPDTEDNLIKIKIQNIGTGSADLVTAKLILPEGITPTESYSNIANLGTIASGGVGEASFYLDIDSGLEPKDYLASLEIRYRDSNGARSEYKTQILEADISVRPAPTFEIESITTTPEPITQGDSIGLNIVLKNTGSEEAKTVSFKLYKQNDQPFTLDEKYDFIGNIKPGETGQAGLKITVDNDAALKNHLLEGEIRYLVGNDVFVVTKQIPVRVATAKASGINPLYIAAGLAVMILIGFYYVRRRKKK